MEKESKKIDSLKILVPTDFSEQANNALYLAVQILEKHEGEIILLHIVDSQKTTLLGVNLRKPNQPLEDEYLSYLTETAEKSLSKLISDTDKIKISPKIEVGNIFKVIEKNRKEQNIDLVIMGTNGASGLSEFLLGSNTEKVVRKSSCPVLAVPAHIHNFKFKNIIFGTSLDEKQIPAIEKLQVLQEFLAATLHLVFINLSSRFMNNDDIKIKAEKIFKKLNLQNNTWSIHEAVTEEEGIIEFAQQMKGDVIALATHQRTGISHFLNGSIAESVVNHAKMPILTIGMKYLES